jgi:hypothetical protein
MQLNMDISRRTDEVHESLSQVGDSLAEIAAEPESGASKLLHISYCMTTRKGRTFLG